MRMNGVSRWPLEWAALGLALALVTGCSGESGTDRGDEVRGEFVDLASDEVPGDAERAADVSSVAVTSEGAEGTSAPAVLPGGPTSADRADAPEEIEQSPEENHDEEEVRTIPELPPPSLAPAASRPAAPDLTLTDLSGREVSLADLRGRVVLINFWATWCPPCKHEIPHLVRLQETYGDLGLTILGVSVDQKGIAAVRPFVRGRPEINYTIIPNGIRAAQAFRGISHIPTTFVLDKQGRILKRFRGLPTGHEMEAYVQAALREA